MATCQWNANGVMSCLETFASAPKPTVFTYSIDVIVQDNSQTQTIASYSYPFVSTTQNPLVRIRPNLFQQTTTLVTLTLQDMTYYKGQPPLVLYVYPSPDSKPILVSFKNTTATSNGSKISTVVVPNLPFKEITVAFARM